MKLLLNSSPIWFDSYENNVPFWGWEGEWFAAIWPVRKLPAWVCLNQCLDSGRTCFSYSTDKRQRGFGAYVVLGFCFLWEKSFKLCYTCWFAQKYLCFFCVKCFHIRMCHSTGNHRFRALTSTHNLSLKSNHSFILKQIFIFCTANLLFTCQKYGPSSILLTDSWQLLSS